MRFGHIVEQEGDTLTDMAKIEPSGNDQRTTLVIDLEELRRA